MNSGNIIAVTLSSNALPLDLIVLREQLLYTTSECIALESCILETYVWKETAPVRAPVPSHPFEELLIHLRTALSFWKINPVW